jgi:hypothetical protein
MAWSAKNRQGFIPILSIKAYPAGCDEFVGWVSWFFRRFWADKPA